MYYEKLEEIFREESKRYDRYVLENLSNRLVHHMALEYLLACFKEHEIVLDVGCGTGLQAIPLARKGCEVIAIDVSEDMLNILKKKIHELGLKNLKIYKMPASEIERLRNEYGEEYFDGAYSFFGVLNAEPNLLKFKSGLLKLLKKGGIAVFVIINLWCIYDLITLKPRKNMEQFKNILYRIYSPKEFLKYFNEFRVLDVRGLRILMPHQRSKIKHESILNLLFKIDRRLYNLPILKYLGSDFLVKLSK